MKNDDVAATLVALVMVILLVILAITAFSFVGGLVLMLAWNYSVASIFEAVPAISYWQAYALSWLLSILLTRFNFTSKKN